MKTAILVKNNELAGYPADLLIENKVIKSFNIEFECEKLGVKMIVGKSLPSVLIKKLRDKGILFLKIENIEALKGLDLDVSFFNESKIKRGAGCQSRFFI